MLLNDVSDHAENYTRFVSVANHTRIDRDDERLWHTSVRFVTHHHPGALLSAIEPLARYGVNMAALQSRPIPGKPWNYQFYAKPSRATRSTPPWRRPCRVLEENVAEIGYLGCYPAFARAE